MAWQAFQEVARGWRGDKGIRIGQGFDFNPFGPIVFGSWGVGSGQFFYFGGAPLGPYLFSYYIPIPPVWLC